VSHKEGGAGFTVCARDNPPLSTTKDRRPVRKRPKHGRVGIEASIIVRVGPRVKHEKGPQRVREGEALGYRAKEEVDSVLEGLPLGPGTRHGCPIGAKRGKARPCPAWANS
jgi:hypothetical protein